MTCDITDQKRIFPGNPKLSQVAAIAAMANRGDDLSDRDDLTPKQREEIRAGFILSFN